MKAYTVMMVALAAIINAPMVCASPSQKVSLVGIGDCLSLEIRTSMAKYQTTPKMTSTNE